ncbi:antibiotic biosynthesis monooxygenase family protein [Facklamia miroungae]|uniref:Heme-degrading monooxygenase HmoA n=1 Tax=Facklamia miroungae TaxID=120956 RepID=A0A1G7QH40_9LACT|nr:antibiotic biosynthesis monooxygenase [Facklamia miroungae]NKZ28915.1 antibiotic biosynthesis monooxygenase [Facklamia miroungae]SDF96930.1 Heme-degrading monooxygenase HmoA [Facklamia miroungae]
MFLIMQHIIPKAGKAENIINKLSNRELITKQPGFINLSVSKGIEEDLIVVLGSWKSKEDWENWENSEERKKLGDPDKDHIESIESHKLQILKDEKMPK